MSNEGWGNFFQAEDKTRDLTVQMTVTYGGDIYKIKYHPVGDLGVVISGEPYRIVHVPTRGCFDHAIPNGEWSNDQLIEWCKRILFIDHMRDTWNSLKLVSDADDWTNDEQVRARGRILDWCRSVKVR